MVEKTSFVHVIESPSSIDLLDGRTEGRSLCAFLDIANIPNSYCLATDSQTFELAMSSRLLDAVNAHSVWPIFHISAHGNDQGIALTNKEFIAWNQLSGYLERINSIREHSLLCLSTCQGSSARKMAFGSESLPTSVLIGCEGDVDWHQAVIAYVTFYNHLLKIGSPINTAVDAMNLACGRKDFKMVNVKSTFSILQLVKSLTPQEKQEMGVKLRGLLRERDVRLSHE